MKKSSLVLGVVTGMLVFAQMAWAQSQGEICRDNIRIEFNEMWNKGKVELFDQAYALNAITHDPGVPGGVRPSGGAAQFKAVRDPNVAGMPDLTFKIIRELVAGDFAITEYAATGTNTAPLFGFPATGKIITTIGVQIARCQGGKIVENWNYYDGSALPLAIGMFVPQNPPK